MMRPELPALRRLTIKDYEQKEHLIKLFELESFDIKHEHASFLNAFALRLCGDKDNGTYVEIGSSDWIKDNHTYMLEKEFGWTGVGIEIQEHYVDEYNKNRSNPCILGDATNFDWDRYFEENNFPRQIDHLSIDTDTSNLMSLINLPLSRYRFSTIVIENQDIINNKQDIDRKVQKIQQGILSEFGYTLIGSGYVEDFWIDNDYLGYGGSQIDPIRAAFWYGSAIA